jgi:hypothetical protein
MKPEKRQLIHDLLDDQPAARRGATLLAGGRILRWRCRRRMALQVLAVVAILGIAALCLEKMNRPQTRVVTAVPASPVQPQKAGLTDEELLALFPNTPVALATLENGKKRLIFLRPGDEKRLMTRL